MWQNDNSCQGKSEIRNGLTRDRAIDLSIRIWAELAETGGDYSEKEKIASRYGNFDCNCPLCEYAGKEGRRIGVTPMECPHCPYYQKYGLCEEPGKPYNNWICSYSSEDAKSFLDQLLQLKGDKVYKVVASIDGVLHSLTKGYGQDLIYEEGKILDAPEGSMGIFVEPDMTAAHNQAQANSGYWFTDPSKSQYVAIHEAVPLGEQLLITRETFFSNRTRYPAILLGKEVWNNKLSRPEPRFKVGDRVRLLYNCQASGTNSRKVGNIYTVTNITWGFSDSITGEDIDHPHYHYPIEGASPLDEDWLELVPPEEKWVNVTSECTLTWYPCDGVSLISVHHKGARILLIGADGNGFFDRAKESYKLEIGTHSTCGSWFKILHKQAI